MLGSNQQDIYYVLSFCENICLQGICILGEVKEEEDEEDGRASPPPFQPGQEPSSLQPPEQPLLAIDTMAAWASPCHL